MLVDRLINIFERIQKFKETVDLTYLYRIETESFFARDAAYSDSKDK